MDTDEVEIIIIDEGSYTIKTRWVTHKSPFIVRSVVGTSIVDQQKHYVADDAINTRGILNLSYPIKNGIITNNDEKRIKTTGLILMLNKFVRIYI